MKKNHKRFFLNLIFSVAVKFPAGICLFKVIAETAEQCAKSFQSWLYYLI